VEESRTKRLGRATKKNEPRLKEAEGLPPGHVFREGKKSIFEKKNFKKGGYKEILPGASFREAPEGRPITQESRGCKGERNPSVEKRDKGTRKRRSQFPQIGSRGKK